MIKIIKNGYLHPNTKTIYKIKCKNCGCIFECELSDFEEIEKKLNGFKKIHCPFCKEELCLYPNNYETREEEIVEIPVPMVPNMAPQTLPTGNSRGILTPRSCEECEFYQRISKLPQPFVGDTPCNWCANRQAYCLSTAGAQNKCLTDPEDIDLPQ